MWTKTIITMTGGAIFKLDTPLSEVLSAVNSAISQQKSLVKIPSEAKNGDELYVMVANISAIYSES